MLYLPSYSFLVRLYIQHVNWWTIFRFREGAKGGKNHNAKQVKNKTKKPSCYWLSIHCHAPDIHG